MSCSTTGTLEDLARATERTKSYVMLEALRKTEKNWGQMDILRRKTGVR